MMYAFLGILLGLNLFQTFALIKIAQFVLETHVAIDNKED